ncbi:MAG: hypothetical protein IT326_00035, partial [Anaerolineae bacterium]|nr:hypothetical protein [Anaerolineae bacterium]
LDRVICCYDDMPALVSRSTALAARAYAVVLPIDSWAARLAVWGQHRLAGLFGWQYRMFAHSTREVDALAQAAGLERRFYRRMGIWQVIVYGRTG